MIGTTAESAIARSLGDEAPILADGRKAPDRRDVSLRWLAGTFLTGITSSVLMGVALFAALDGRQQLAIPAEAYAMTENAGNGASADNVVRGKRLLETKLAPKQADRTIMEVATVTNDGKKEVVRRMPFAHVTMALATDHSDQDDYPPFDPLNIFAANIKQAPATLRTGLIYASDVDSDVSLKTEDFPLKASPYPFAGMMTLTEIEENVRSNGSVLSDGQTQLASLSYVDPRRFANDDLDLGLSAGLTAKIVDQNLSVAMPDSVTPDTPEYADDVLPIRQDMTIEKALNDGGYSEKDAEAIIPKLAETIGSKDLKEGDVLRIGVLQKGEDATVIRASVYRDQEHFGTVAVNDKGRFVTASEPAHLDAVDTAFNDDAPPPPKGRHDLPRVYDAIYQASLAYGMNPSMTAQIIRLLGSNVDFQAKVKPKDTLEAFFSVSDEKGKATEDSELLFVHAKLGDLDKRFYRFQDPDDNSVDYYDENGKSVRQFLLRKPVPNGRFTSGFGMRRHPILKYARMHPGVDWAAPIGSPILAAGDGVVIKAGEWTSGYGKQTLIQHANGYVSSYNHQSAVAKGLSRGQRVKQGQVIGFIGTTGLSTGPHLHFELIVNGTKVDPMKIRLPSGNSLDGEALAKFESERKRIDALLGVKNDDKEVASIN